MKQWENEPIKRKVKRLALVSFVLEMAKVNIVAGGIQSGQIVAFGYWS